VAHSFDRKLDRAEHHLVDLKDRIARFLDDEPCTVRSGVEKQKKRDVTVHRVQYKPIDPQIELIAGDFLYNARTALDYLAGALVPPRERSHVMFPMLAEPVWEIPFAEGENLERTKARERWTVVTRRMHPHAVALLQQMQPLDDGTDKARRHALSVLNRLSNTDRHKQVSVVGHAITEGSVTWEESEHTPPRRVRAPLDILPGLALQDNATLTMAPGAVNVKLEVTPRVGIRMSEAEGHIWVPEVFDLILSLCRKVCELLTPYIFGAPGPFPPNAPVITRRA
jgi:hypothetical protein